MTYTSGGLIEATDYNNLVGSNPTDVAGTLNRILATGNNDRGYGQTAVSQVSVGNTVTATQWASLINNLNNCYAHQTGSPTAQTAPTVGSLISFNNSLSGHLTDIYNNRLTANATGSTTTYSGSFSMTAAAGSPSTGSVLRYVDFSTVDQCRYFWNAGGRITFDITSATNNNGTARSGNIVTLTNTNFNAKTLFARSAGARTGTGGTVITDVTASGFYDLNLISYDLYSRINSTSYVDTGDYVDLNTKGYVVTGYNVNGGNGRQIGFLFQAYSSTTGSTGTDDELDVTVNYTVTVTYPSTTYLTASWGTAIIT